MPKLTAIDELRRLLDELGVEYEGGERSVRWRDRNGVMMQAFPLADGELGMDVWSCTPEQAIAATLGSSSCTNNCTNGERTVTCNADETETWECVCDQIGRYGKRVTVHVMECSECGHTYEHVNGDYEFCPRCGRRIEEVDA